MQVGNIKASKTLASQFETANPDTDTIQAIEKTLSESEIYSIDALFARAAADLIMETRKQGDSLGGVVEVVAVNVPALIGAPLYNSLKLRLMGSLGGLHAVRGVEIGAGNEVVTRRGSQNNDPIAATVIKPTTTAECWAA